MKTDEKNKAANEVLDYLLHDAKIDKKEARKVLSSAYHTLTTQIKNETQ